MTMVQKKFSPSSLGRNFTALLFFSSYMVFFPFFASNSIKHSSFLVDLQYTCDNFLAIIAFSSALHAIKYRPHCYFTVLVYTKSQRQYFANLFVFKILSFMPKLCCQKAPLISMLTGPMDSKRSRNQNMLTKGINQMIIEPSELGMSELYFSRRFTLLQ